MTNHGCFKPGVAFFLGGGVPRLPPFARVDVPDPADAAQESYRTMEMDMAQSK
jgi:hypothetical protein